MVLSWLGGCAGPEPSVVPPRETRSVKAVSPPKVIIPESPRRTLDGEPPLSRVNALAIAPSLIPTSDLDAWAQRLARRGVTLILLDIGTQGRANGMTRHAAVTQQPRHGVYFHTGWAETVRDLFGTLVPAAHQHRIAVFARVSLRDMPWVDSALGWLDRAFDPPSRRLTVSPALDVFHPAYQEYLVGLLTDLAATGLDGVLFSDEPPIGIYDGLTPFALRGFERDFHLPLDSQRLFTAADASAHGQSRYRPEFWQWVGWRTRERLRLLDRLMRAMRMKTPAIDCAVELHPEAVTDPVGALAMYSEDLLETKRRCRYEVLTVAPRANRHLVLAPVVEQMASLMGRPERVWVMIAPGLTTQLVPAVSQPDQPAGLPAGVGLVYLDAVPDVP